VPANACVRLACVIVTCSFRARPAPADRLHAHALSHTHTCAHVLAQAESPIGSAGFFSRMSYSYVNYLFRIGKQRPIELDDLSPIHPNDAADGLTERLARAWDSELARADAAQRTPRIFRAILVAFAPILLTSALWGVTEAACLFGQSIFLAEIVNAMSNNQAGESATLLWTMGLVLCSLGHALTHHGFFFQTMRCGMQMRTATTGLVVRKLMRLDLAALARVSRGFVFNIVSNDLQRFDYFMVYAHFIWLAPIMSALALYLIWRLIGPASLAGMGVLVGLLPIQGLFARRFAAYRGKTVSLTDKRVKTMTEIVQGMRVIKMYAWEEAFADVVQKLRAAEMAFVR
jgi:ATP-binding cassette, subfamily C (CFTR/MRP), member 4